MIQLSTWINLENDIAGIKVKPAKSETRDRYLLRPLVRGTRGQCHLSLPGLIVYFSFQTRNNLQILLPVSIFPILRHLDILMAPLLLSLSHLDPILHSQMLPNLSESILRETKPIQQGTVLNRVQDDMVIGTKGREELDTKIPRLHKISGSCFASKCMVLTGQSIEHPADRHVPGLQGECAHGEHWT